jgi:ATP-dependent DNA ligase
VIDGEAVRLDSDGVSQFDRLHSRKHHDEVRLVAFDLLAVGGDDIRPQPLHARKDRLAKLLSKCIEGIQLSEHMEGEIGPGMFEHACKLGLEGIVSKHRCIAVIAPDGVRTGSRSKIRHPQQCSVRRTSRFDGPPAEKPSGAASIGQWPALKS